MKQLMLRNKIAFWVVVLSGDITTAWAAEAAGEDNGSGLFIWIFLAFCALIVVAQLIPALMMLFGIAKGLKKPAAEKEDVKVTADTPKNEDLRYWFLD